MTRTSQLRQAQPGEMDAVRELFREYAELVGNAICFESYAREMAELPGRYSPLLIAVDPECLAGCVALRKSATASAR